jgi:hypothetical protein
MRLISWTLRSGSEQIIYNLERRQRGPGSKNWNQEKGKDQRAKGKGLKVVLRQHANCRLVSTPRKD